MTQEQSENNSKNRICKAYISDADGYTNVRENPDVSSSILFKILKNEPFFIVDELVSDNWYRIAFYKHLNKFGFIDRNYENEGFIHKSRVKIVPRENIKTFADEFKNITLPLENIGELKTRDTLKGVRTNDILIRNQYKRPNYIDKIAQLQVVKKYYGLYPETPMSYSKIIKNDEGIFVGKQLYFHNKINPIGRINLNDDYITLLIKVIASETTFYDLWNFDKNGYVLSVVCLFWGMRDNGMEDEQVTFVIVDSMINKEGEIIWHENSDGLETFRTYILNKDGYFQIINEEQKGEMEF
jgi:hypothetical protein